MTLQVPEAVMGDLMSLFLGVGGACSEPLVCESGLPSSLLQGPGCGM